MKDITIRGKIEFKSAEMSEYNREFTATLTESPAFSYGNHTAVVISYSKLANGSIVQPKMLDTRYDTTIRANKDGFTKWLENYFKNEYLPHTLTIY